MTDITDIIIADTANLVWVFIDGHKPRIIVRLLFYELRAILCGGFSSVYG